MNQLGLFEEITQIKIITHQGSRIFNLAVSDMKEFILKQSQELRLWLYIDGVNTNPVKIDTSIISSAKEIILTLPLVGG